MKPAPAPPPDPSEGDVDWAPLLSAANAGDTAAWEELAVRLGPRLRGLLRGLGAPAEELDDLAIEALDKVLRALPSVRNGDLFPWACALTRNHLRDYFRHRHPSLARPESNEEIPAAPRQPRSKPSPLILAVRRWLLALSSEDQHLLNGRAHAVPFPRLAQELGITHVAARARASRLLKRLEQFIRSDPTLSPELERRTTRVSPDESNPQPITP